MNTFSNKEVTLPAWVSFCIDSGQTRYLFLMNLYINRVNPQIHKMFRFKLKT